MTPEVGTSTAPPVALHGGPVGRRPDVRVPCRRDLRRRDESNSSLKVSSCGSWTATHTVEARAFGMPSRAALSIRALVPDSSPSDPRSITSHARQRRGEAGLRSPRWQGLRRGSSPPARRTSSVYVHHPAAPPRLASTAARGLVVLETGGASTRSNALVRRR